MRSRIGLFLLSAVLCAKAVIAEPEGTSASFRRANESASHSHWDDAIQEYGKLAKSGVHAPSLYWNWAQVASANGKKGEALWALLAAQELTPSDSTLLREIERIRGELGLDPSEVSLGLLGDARLLARRFRFDAVALVVLLAASLISLRSQSRPRLSFAGFLCGVLLLMPSLFGSWREPRGVIVRKDAPLVDVPRAQAVALANLREGEVVPLLGEEGEYVRIQDASGARGFAHKEDVRRVASEP